MAIDFLGATDCWFSKTAISNITLPATGWSIGVWVQINQDNTSTIDQLLSINGNQGVANAINIYRPNSSNASTAAGLDPLNGNANITITNRLAFSVTPYEASTTSYYLFSPATYANSTAKYLLVLTWDGAAWKYYIVSPGGTAAPVRSNTPTSNAGGIDIAVSSIFFGNRVDGSTIRDWGGCAGQLFLLGKPLSNAQVTALAAADKTIVDVIAATGSGLTSADLLGYWPAESRATSLTDQSSRGNNLAETATQTANAGFNFVTAAAPSLAAASTTHAHSSASASLTQQSSLAAVAAAHAQTAQAASLTLPGVIAAAATGHAHSATSASLGASFPAPVFSRPAGGGDGDLARCNATSPTAQAVTLNLYGDGEYNENRDSTSWEFIWLAIQLGVAGRTVSFSMDMADWCGGAPVPAGYAPVWRYAGETRDQWKPWANVSIDNTNKKVTGQISGTLTGPAIEIALVPPFGYSDVTGWLAERTASYPALMREPASSSAYRATTGAGIAPSLIAAPQYAYDYIEPATSPDGIAVSGTGSAARFNLCWAISGSGNTRPDGSPKYVVLHDHTHAGEQVGLAAMFAVADRLLGSSAADAAWHRANAIHIFYTGNMGGIIGGMARGNCCGGVDTGEDPNRSFWIDTSGSVTSGQQNLLQIDALCAAQKLDIASSSYAGGMSWHGVFGLASGYMADYQSGLAGQSLLLSNQVRSYGSVTSLGTALLPGRSQYWYDSVLGGFADTAEFGYGVSDFYTANASAAAAWSQALRDVLQAKAASQPVTASHAHSATACTLGSTAALAAASTLHSHSATAAAMVPQGTLGAASARHAHSTGTAALAAPSLLAAAGAQHGHSASNILLFTPGAVSPLSSRHDHRAQSPALLPPPSSSARRRERKIPSDRRTLRLRFS